MVNVVIAQAGLKMVMNAMDSAVGAVRENLSPVFARQTPAVAKAPVRNNTISPKAE